MTYKVILKNQQCVFDKGEFSGLKAARSWASGRGMEHNKHDNKWEKYTVTIHKDNKLVKEYKTQ